MRYARQFAVFLVLLVVCGFLLYSAYIDIESKTIAQINNEQIVHAGQAASGIENFFAAYNDSLSFLAVNDHIITLDPDGRELMRDFFTSHNGEISSITRVDENGIIIYTYPVETSSGANISSQSHVRQELSTHSVVISDVFTSVQGFRTVAFHMPVFRDGEFRGSIAVLIPFDALAKENLGGIRILDSGYAWTISKSGVILYSPDPDQVGTSVFEIFNTSPSVIAMAQDAVKGSRGITAYTVIGNPIRKVPDTKFQAIYQPVTIGTTSWSIIVSTPENEILGTIQGFRNNLVIIFAILILSLFFFTFYLARARGIVQEEEIRRKADAALRESEHKYRTLVENIPEKIFVKDTRLAYVSCNDHYARDLGIPAGAIAGKTDFDFFPASLAEQYRADDRAIMESGTVREIEERYVSGGRENWISTLKTPLRDEAGHVTGILGIFHDITERKREEQALNENEQRLTSIYNTVGDTIFQLTVEPGGQYRFTSVNSAFSRTTGIPSDQVIGRTVSEIIPEPALSMVLGKYRQAIAEKTIVRWEETSSYPTGQLTGEVSIAPIFDTEGTCTHLIGSVHDFTERKKAERELLQRNRALRLISSADSLLVHATDERALTNEICTMITQTGGYHMTWIGYAVNDEAKSVRPVAHSGFDDNYLAAIDITWADTERGHGPTGTVIRTGQPYLARDIPNNPAFGPWREEAIRRGYHSSIALPLEYEGTILGALNIYSTDPDAFNDEEIAILTQLSKDLSFGIQTIRGRVLRAAAEKELRELNLELEKRVSERTYELTEANEKLQQLDRLKSMFIASMSHELRTPLNSIIGFTGILAKGMAGEINPEQKKQLGMVQDSARHLLALINDVIDISKIEAGKIEAGISSFNLADVILEVSHTFSREAQERGLVLNIEIPGPVTVTSDERRIKQIIMNLVSNAIKFTDSGRIDLTVHRNGEVVEVRVRDTGIGIGKQDLEGLFRPFARVMVPGRLTEGTGLGLYLSKKIARFLGGDITAESEPNTGSIFRFMFPITYVKQEDA